MQTQNRAYTYACVGALYHEGCAGDHMRYWGLNTSWLHSRQTPYLLHHCSNSKLFLKTVYWAWFRYIFEVPKKLNSKLWWSFVPFQVERGSPKSCFLFLGSILCEVNWVSVLFDAWDPRPQPETRSMVVSLLFMMVLLAKEDELIEQTVSLGPVTDSAGPYHLLRNYPHSMVPQGFSQDGRSSLSEWPGPSLHACFSQLIDHLIPDDEEMVWLPESIFFNILLIASSATRLGSSLENWVLNII